MRKFAVLLKQNPRTLSDMTDFLFDTMTVYDRKSTKPAAVRNAIGEVAEEFACRALGMQRLRVDGRKKLCADAMLGDSPVEIKSIGRSRTGLLYKWRRDKELKAYGRDYLYVFVLHDCTIKTSGGAEIVLSMRDTPPAILITTLGRVVDAIGDKPVRTFRMFDAPPPEQFDRKTMHGSQRAGYVEGGWQFRIKDIPVRYSTTTTFQWCGNIVTSKLLHS